MSLQVVKEYNLCDDNWGDSHCIAYFDGKIHGLGQARKAIYTSNLHYVWDTSGNILHKITAPWDARSEALASTLNGKLYVIGGTTTQDVWEFDPTVAGYTAGSWSVVNSTFVSAIGNRYMAAGGDLGGWFYIIGGWGATTVYKTQNFTSWTSVATLPGALSKLSACGFCVMGSLFYLVGGSTNMPTNDATGLYAGEYKGYVYTMDASGTFTLLTTDQLKFGQIWCDLGTDGTYLYLSKGYIDPTQFGIQFPVTTGINAKNNRGVYRSTDGVTWTSVTLTDGLATYFERHRAGIVNVSGTAYLIGGFNANDMWKIV